MSKSLSRAVRKMIGNAAEGHDHAFDPYPYIILNLLLSCLAAIQAPIIMMSQRRTEAKDRLRSLNDYQVNLKAELEIRHLHEKIDHMLTRQWDRLAEMQEVQIELLEELGRRPSGAKRPAAPSHRSRRGRADEDS